MAAVIHKVAGRKSAAGLTRRERLMNERLRASPMRDRFPKIDQLRVSLVFSEPESRVTLPSPQAHTFFPAASAYFRFPCPCADCDGDFDLSDAITQLSGKAATRGRSTSASGQLSCQGVRFRDHASLQGNCVMQVHFELSADPHR